jgi:hypothetical protein
MASAKTLDRISAAWSSAEWMARPGRFSDPEKQQEAQERLERVKDLQRAARDLPDWKIADAFPEFRAQLFTDADLRRIGWSPSS